MQAMPAAGTLISSQRVHRLPVLPMYWSAWRRATMTKGERISSGTLAFRMAGRFAWPRPSSSRSPVYIQCDAVMMLGPLPCTFPTSRLMASEWRSS